MEGKMATESVEKPSVKILQACRLEEIQYKQHLKNNSKCSCKDTFGALSRFRYAIHMLQENRLSRNACCLVHAVDDLYTAIAEDYTLLDVIVGVSQPPVGTAYYVADLYLEVCKHLLEQHKKACTDTVSHAQAKDSAMVEVVMQVELAYASTLLNRLISDLSGNVCYEEVFPELGSFAERESFHSKLVVVFKEFAARVLAKDLELLVAVCSQATKDDPALVAKGDGMIRKESLILPGARKIIAVSNLLLGYREDDKTVSLVVDVLGYYLCHLGKSSWKKARADCLDSFYKCIATSNFVHTHLRNKIEHGAFNAYLTAWPVLQQAATVCDKAVDAVIEHKLAMFVLFLSHDPESNHWSNQKPFYEEERCSFSIEMLSYYLQGFLHDLKAFVPGLIAVRIFAAVISGIYAFLCDRYCSVSPARRNVKQYSADVTLALCIMATFLPYLAPAHPPADHLAASHLHRIHRSCQRLLSVLVVMSCPLDNLQDLLEVQKEEAQKQSCASWLVYCRRFFGYTALKNGTYSLEPQLRSPCITSDSVLHFACTLNHSTSQVVALLLTDECWLAKLLICSPHASPQLVEAVLTILDGSLHHPEALGTVVCHYLKSQHSNSTLSFRIALESRGLESWLVSHFDRIAHLIRHFNLGVCCLLSHGLEDKRLTQPLFSEKLASEAAKGIACLSFPMVLTLKAIVEHYKSKFGIKEVVLHLLKLALERLSDTSQPVSDSRYREIIDQVLLLLEDKGIESAIAECLAANAPGSFQDELDSSQQPVPDCVVRHLETAYEPSLNLVIEVFNNNTEILQQHLCRNPRGDVVLNATNPSSDRKKAFDPIASSQTLINAWPLDFEVLVSAQGDINEMPELRSYVAECTPRPVIIEWIRQRYEFQDNAVLSEEMQKTLQTVNRLL